MRSTAVPVAGRSPADGSTLARHGPHWDRPCASNSLERRCGLSNFRRFASFRRCDPSRRTIRNPGAPRARRRRAMLPAIRLWPRYHRRCLPGVVARVRIPRVGLRRSTSVRTPHQTTKRPWRCRCSCAVVGVLGVLLAAAAPPPPPPPPLGRSTAVPCDGAPSEGRWPASAGAAASARPAAARASLKLMPLSLPTLLMAPPPKRIWTCAWPFCNRFAIDSRPKCAADPDPGRLSLSCSERSRPSFETGASMRYTRFQRSPRPSHHVSRDNGPGGAP